MRTIYRFESEDGRGMYHFDTALKNMQSNKSHPAPHEDKKLCKATGGALYGDDRHYAFADHKQLHAWVRQKAWLKSMHEEGLVLAEYWCKNKDVFDGEKQVIFQGYKSKKQYDILTYFKEVLDKPQNDSKIEVVIQFKTTTEGEFK